MANEFVNNQVDKIIADKAYSYPLNIAMASTWLLGNLKGVNLRVLDVSKQSSLADYFVLASASNSTQAQAMAEEIIYQMKRAGHSIVSREGLAAGADWILLDVGDIIVHVFLESSRDAYNLDGLWVDAKHMPIPQDYYFSDDDANRSSGSDDRGFF